MTKTKQDIEACEEMLRNEDVKSMCKIFFDIDLSAKQEEVVRAIAFEKSKRIVVSAFTRYGKSYCVAMGVCLYILLHTDKRIMLIAPIQQQTSILRNYISAFLLAHEDFKNLLDIELRGLDRLKSEVSKSRITFKNGNQLVILSAEGTAERLMGWGGGLVVCVPANSKIETDMGRLKIKDIVDNHIPCKILSYNHQTRGLEWKAIKEYYDNGLNDILTITAGKYKFQCTYGHPVYVKGYGYVRADELKVGDVLMGLGGSLNRLNVKYTHANNKVRQLRQGVLQEAGSYKEEQLQYVQPQMRGHNIFQKVFPKNSIDMRHLWKGNNKKEGGLCKTSSSFLFSKMSRPATKRKEKFPIRGKGSYNLQGMQEGIRGYTCSQEQEILQHSMQKHRTFTVNDCCGQSCVERRDWKRAIRVWIYKKIQGFNKDQIQGCLSVMRRSSKEKLPMYSSHRLRQEELKGGQSNTSLFQLSCQDQLPQGVLDAATITNIKKEKRPAHVYNLSIEDNHNFFVNDILTHNCDESCLIDYEVYRQRISRMLGDDPNSMFVEIGNPWHRNNQMYEHWCDPSFLKIHIGYKDGITEGRITPEFVEEQRKLLTPTEFTVLYEADFPEEAEDQLIKRDWVMAAINKPLMLNSPKRILGLDVAEFGRDWTVLTVGATDGSLYRVMDIKSWSKQDTMVTVGQVSTYIQDGRIKVDAIGVGSGVASRLSELNYNVLAVKVGEGAEEAKKLSENLKRDTLTERSRFSNKKAQYYWELRELFEQGRISIPDHATLISELLKMRYELNSSARIKIIDPEKSPDYSDSLMLFCAETKKPKFVFDFANIRQDVY